VDTKSFKYQLITLFTFVVVIVSTEHMLAQKDISNKRQQLEAEKIAFITKQISLTSTEAQQFWPLYNECQQKRNELQKQRRQIMKKMLLSESLNNKELEDLSDQYINIQSDESKLLTQYHQKFKSALPIQKVIGLYKAEDKFKIYLLRQVQKNSVVPDN